MTSAVPVPPTPPPTPSDDGVPRITSMRKSDGWGYRASNETEPEIFIDPAGVEYVMAHHREPADLIREHPLGMSDTRLRRYADSAAFKRHRRLERANKRDDE